MLLAFAEIFHSNSTHVFWPRSERAYSRTMHYDEAELLQRECLLPPPAQGILGVCSGFVAVGNSQLGSANSRPFQSIPAPAGFRDRVVYNEH